MHDSISEKNKNIEHYFNVQIQIFSDFENLGKLIASVESQQRQLEEQVSEIISLTRSN